MKEQARMGGGIEIKDLLKTIWEISSDGKAYVT